MSKETTTTSLLTRKDLAQMFGVTLTCIDNWRKKNLAPSEIRIGTNIFYKKETVEKFLEEKTISKTELKR